MKHALIAAAVCLPVYAHSAASAWPALARTDLDFVYKTIEDNHPGAIDRQNPDFRRWMDKGYAEARARADKAASLGDVKHLLSRYLAGFADGHLIVSFAHQKRTLDWPGIFLRREGSSYVVAHRQDGWGSPLPALGARLVSCDGRPAEQLMDEDVLPAVFNHTGLEWVRSAAAYYLFVTEEIAAHPQYKECVFADSAVVASTRLSWSEIRRGEFEKLWDAAHPSVEMRSTITQVGPQAFWVHLPVFKPNREQEDELKQLTARMPTLRAAKLIVFDVRGNGGGNSQWGSDVLAGLYGKDYMAQLAAARNDQGYAEWRVSKDNLAHLEAVVIQLKQQFSPGTPIVATFSSLATRMAAALARGDAFVRQSEPAAPAARKPEVPPLSQAKIVFVTDSECASSCLDFADEVLSIPGVRHLGLTTAADTVFMDVRKVGLPSGLGRLVVAQKVYRGRQRAHNQVYVPSAHFGGRIGDTEAVRKWVLDQAQQAPSTAGGGH